MTAPDRLTFYLRSRADRTRAAEAVGRALQGYVVVIRPAGRTLAQNSRLHAMLTDIATRGIQLSDEARR